MSICVYVYVFSFLFWQEPANNKAIQNLKKKEVKEENCNIFCELHLPQGIYHKMYFVSDYITLAGGMRKQPHWEIVRHYH